MWCCSYNAGVLGEKWADVGVTIGDASTGTTVFKHGYLVFLSPLSFSPCSTVHSIYHAFQLRNWSPLLRASG